RTDAFRLLRHDDVPHSTFPHRPLNYNRHASVLARRSSMLWHTGVAALFLSGLAAAAVCSADNPRLDYPQTRRIDHVDDYHGTKVADPYRWLEDDVRKSKDVADWVEAENKVTFAYLESIPERDALKRRLTELWNYEKYT